jgi:phytanoyl-CoA hydroxylase
MLTPSQIFQFKNFGYVVVPEFSPLSYCESVIAIARSDLKQQVMPIEYEADVCYPGAPLSRTAEGGNTARRLLRATQRNTKLMDWATSDSLKVILRQLLGEQIFLSQSHHNCIMTKKPTFSSSTGWHRDNRNWKFERPDLVSAWLALTNEHEENGCLWVIPNSHKWEIDSYQLDKHQFLRTDFDRNIDLIKNAVPILLNEGDLLLTHSNLFQAAGRNTTTKTMYSMAFTYRAADNLPIRGTRSASVAEIPL